MSRCRGGERARNGRFSTLLNNKHLENSRGVEDLRENKSLRETSGITGKSISANFKDYACSDLWPYRLDAYEPRIIFWRETHE